MIEPKSQVKKCSAHAEILQQNDERTVYRLRETDGEVRITAYPVFPGIELAYHDVHAPSYRLAEPGAAGLIEIQHCREGRAEYCCGGEHYFLAPGDLSVVRRAAIEGRWNSPRGTTTASPSRSTQPSHLTVCPAFLQDVDVRPSVLAEKFFADSECFVSRSSARVEHIFSELYAVPAGIRRGYFKVKVLELLLFLSALDVAHEKHSYTAAQVRLARAARDALLASTEDDVTISALAQELGASPSQLAASFRGVYGMTPAAFSRAQKMHSAAQLLRTSDRTVLDIAGQFGYDNASKFAKAFRSVIGVSPSAYRAGADSDSCAPTAEKAE
ncbi:MAG: helix-turn-helix transcriptional regulator [Oscillibacter sp.]